jgi:hypothetical protein
LLQNQAAEVHCFQAVDAFGKEIGIYASDRDPEFILTQLKEVRLRLGQA